MSQRAQLDRYKCREKILTNRQRTNVFLKPIYFVAPIAIFNLLGCAKLEQPDSISSDDLSHWYAPDQVKRWMPQIKENLDQGYKNFATGDYRSGCGSDTPELCRHIYEWIQVRDFSKDEVFRFSLVMAPHFEENFLCGSMRRSLVSNETIDYGPAKDGKLYLANTSIEPDTSGSDSECLNMVSKNSFYITREAIIKFSESEIYKEHLVLRDVYPDGNSAESRPFFDGFANKFPILYVWR